MHSIGQYNIVTLRGLWEEMKTGRTPLLGESLTIATLSIDWHSGNLDGGVKKTGLGR